MRTYDSIFETGGQDDLLTIFSPWDQRVIARCQGHSSFVTSVAFDDLRCDGRTYRFGSVGEDNKLILVRVLISILDETDVSLVGFLQWRPSQAQISGLLWLLIIHCACQPIIYISGHSSTADVDGIDGFSSLPTRSVRLIPAIFSLSRR